MTSSTRNRSIVLILVGLSGGLLSGLFGIGGGTVIVPGLVLILGMPQRLAAGTSVAAILPAAITGAISYAVTGHVNWLAGTLLALGIIGGSQIGSFLLARMPVRILQWSFVGFLLIVIVSLWFVVPRRDGELALSLLSGASLVLLGLITGVLSGLLGVGGGVIVVPILMFFFGMSDLAAKGTSLLMMIPGSISGTLGNWRRKNVDLRAAAVVGIAACLASPLGSLIAQGISPIVSNIAFSIFLIALTIQLVTRLVRINIRPAK